MLLDLGPKNTFGVTLFSAATLFSIASLDLFSATSSSSRGSSLLVFQLFRYPRAERLIGPINLARIAAMIIITGTFILQNNDEMSCKWPFNDWKFYFQSYCSSSCRCHLMLVHDGKLYGQHLFYDVISRALALQEISRDQGFQGNEFVVQLSQLVINLLKMLCKYSLAATQAGKDFTRLECHFHSAI